MSSSDEVIVISDDDSQAKGEHDTNCVAEAPHTPPAMLANMPRDVPPRTPVRVTKLANSYWQVTITGRCTKFHGIGRLQRWLVQMGLQISHVPRAMGDSVIAKPVFGALSFVSLSVSGLCGAGV
jgi:hypothetical protein